MGTPAVRQLRPWVARPPRLGTGAEGVYLDAPGAGHGRKSAVSPGPPSATAPRPTDVSPCCLPCPQPATCGT